MQLDRQDRQDLKARLDQLARRVPAVTKVRPEIKVPKALPDLVVLEADRAPRIWSTL